MTSNANGINGRMRTTLITVASVISLSGAGGVGWQVWDKISEQGAQIASLVQLVRSNSERITGLESGRTTPMAIETRVRIEHLEKQLERFHGRPH